MRARGGSPAASISLAADDATVSVTQASTVDIGLTVTRSHWTGTVSLAVSGLPSGVTGSFSDSTLTGAETTSTLTLTASGSASVVTGDAFTITATGSGVSDAVDGTVDVVAGTGAGIPSSNYAYSDFFDANYANTGALRAELRQLSPSPSDPNTGQFYNDAIYPDNLLIAPDPVDGSVNAAKIQILDNTVSSNSEPQTTKSNLTAMANAAFYWVQAYEAGFTTDGSSGTDAYKNAFMLYNNANGRVGMEWTSVNNHTFGGGWTNNGSGNASGSNDLANYTANVPYATGGGSGIWDVPQWVCWLMTHEQIGTDYQLARIWTWLEGDTPTDVPQYSAYYKLNTGTLPQITGIKMGANYNQFGSARTAAPTAIYWREWRVYDLDTEPDPLSMVTPPTVSLSSTALSVARGGSTTVDVTITRGAYTGTITPSFYSLNNSGLSVSASPSLTSGVSSTTLTISATAGATAGTRVDTSLFFSGINCRFYVPITVT